MYWRFQEERWVPETLPAPTGPAPAQSAAYAVARDGASVLVGGYVRDRVSATTLSRPMVWHGGADGWTARLLEVDAAGYGIVYGVTHAGEGHDWACGASGAGGAYAFATCWNAVSGEKTVLPLSLGSNTLASSVVRRVRTIEFGAIGTATFAVGTATTTDGESRGFIYKIAGPADMPVVEWVDGVAGTGSSMLMDLVETSLPRPNRETDFGVMVVGVGELVASSGTPHRLDSASVVGTTYHGISKTFLKTRPVAGPVCDIQNESYAGIGDAAVAASNNGDTRLVWSGSTLYVYQGNYEVRAPQVWVRNTSVTIRPASDEAAAVRETPRHFQVRVPGEATSGLVRWSSSPGCESLVGTGMTECWNARSSIGEGTVLPIITAEEGASRTRTVGGVAPDSEKYPYIQASVGVAANACEISPVHATDARIVRNPREEFNGEHRLWDDCDGDLSNGFETDLLHDYYHCGACGQRVNDDGKWCTLDACVDGKVSRAKLQAGSCHIDGACYRDGELAPLRPNDAPSMPKNPCARCDASAATQWTATGAACCDGAMPSFDPFQKGPRPSVTGGNIAYAGSTLIAPWIARISEVYNSDFWTYSPRGAGGSDAAKRCNLNDRNIGPHVLQAWLTGDANREDWFVFRHRKTGAEKKMEQQPRVRLVAHPTGEELTMCVYATCAGTSSGSALNTLTYSTRAAASNGSQSRGGPNVPAAMSPLSLASGGVAAYCLSGQVVDITLHLENSGCDEADVFVQINAKEAMARPSCTEPYDVYWGNDIHVRDKNGSEIFKDTCTNCCDGAAVNRLRSPL